MDCLFCSIIEKKKDAKAIYEDAAAIAILDVFPRVVGHTLVLPKKHVETILELSEDELGGLWNAVKNTVRVLKETLHPEGFTIGINHGKVSGQAIEHLHVHIMPRFANDGGGSMHSVVEAPPHEPLEKVYGRIVSA